MIVEDHPAFRDTLCAALAGAPGAWRVHTCKDLPAGLALLQAQCPDVLLVDLGLPSGSGMGLIHAAQRLWGQRCASAVLTVTGNEEHILTAVRAGAKGCLFKSDGAADWCASVHMLALGQSPMAYSLARQLAQALQGHPRAEALSAHQRHEIDTFLMHIAAGYTYAELHERIGLYASDAGHLARQVFELLFEPPPALSARELALLQLLNKGSSLKECADSLGVAESTAKTLAARAYAKLGANNMQMALYEARVTGLLT